MAKKNSTKKEILLFLGAIVIGISIFVIYQVITNGNKYEGFHNKVETISYKKYEELVSSDDDFVIIYGSDSCPACNRFKSTYSIALNTYDVKTYYIDADTYNEKQKTTIKSYYNITGTPHTLMFIDGKFVNDLNGAADLERTKQFLEEFTKKSQE